MGTDIRPFGYELLLDLYECAPEVVNDLRVCYDFLENAVVELKVEKQSPPFIFQSPATFPDKAGLSGWVPLIESGIQLHTLTEKNFVSIDYYTCSTVDDAVEKQLIALAERTFFPKRFDKILVERGKDYNK